MSDKELKDKIRVGDHSAIRWLYQQYYASLCTYANRFIRSESISEEIVQQSFFKFWERRDSLQIEETVIGYFYRTVKNNCLNHIKHQQIVNRYNEKYLQTLHETEGALNISQEHGLSVYIANELEDKITTAIENLPEQCRDIFKLSRFDGLKHQEIAKMKGVTLNTVQKQISIALGKLRIELSAYLSFVTLFIISILNKF